MATARYLLENLGFVINLEKSCFVPTQNMEFLGFVVSTQAMTLLLPNSKVESIKSHCNYLLALPEVSVRDLFQLIGKLTASIQAIFPAPLHYRHLQHLKHQALALATKGLRCNNTSVDRGQRGITLVVSHLNAWNGRALLHHPPDIVIETEASRTGWGAVCQGVRTGGLWSQMERKLHINCLELLAGSFAVKSFTKNRLCVHVRLRMDNTSAVTYVNRLGGDSLPISVQSSSGSVGMGTQTGFLSQRRIPIRSPKYCSGLAISELPRFKQLEIMPRGISGSDADPRTLCQGSFCGPTECTVASVFQLEAGPCSTCHGCSSTGLVEREDLCLSSLSPDNAISSEVEGTRGRVSASSTCVAHTSVVPQLAGSVSVSSNPFTYESESFARFSGGDASSDCEPDSRPRRVAYIKQSLQSAGICSDASKLILAARRPDTNAIYNSAWEKWHRWCVTWESDSFRPALTDITSFLSDCFNEGLEYRTLNTYRSALSGVLPPIDGFPVGQHPLVFGC